MHLDKYVSLSEGVGQLAEFRGMSIINDILAALNTTDGLDDLFNQINKSSINIFNYTKLRPIDLRFDFDEEDRKRNVCIGKFSAPGPDAWDYALFAYAVVSILFYAFLKKRSRNYCGFCEQGICRERPGLPCPVKLIEESENRLPYVAAFCLTGFAVMSIVIGESSWKGPPQVKGLVKLCIALIYGITYYPIFAALSSKCTIGYAWGAAYTWISTGMFIAKHLPCREEIAPSLLAVNVLLFIPVILISLYLALLITFKAIKQVCCKRKKEKYFKDVDIPQVRHVKYMLKKHLENSNNRIHLQRLETHNDDTTGTKPEIEHLTFSVTFVQRVKQLFAQRVYVVSPGFTYSVNILSACGMSLLVIYMLFCVALYHNLWFNNMMNKLMTAEALARTLKDRATLDLNSDQQATESRFWKRLIMGVVFASLAFSVVIAFMSVIMILKSYKRDLILMYKGIYISVPRDILSIPPSNITLYATKFIGYQIAYAASSFFLMFFVIVIVLLAVTIFLAITFRYSFYTPLIWLINRFLPPLATLLILYYLQWFIVHTLFVRRNDKGERTLALRNKSIFHNFEYFMLYINAAIGIFSSIMALAKSIFFSIWILGRLDVSSYPKAFEHMDPGFRTYCCMLALDNALRNPTMVVYITLMLESVKRRDRDAKMQSNPSKWKSKSLSYERVCNRWGILVTLINNPILLEYRHSRKGLIKIYWGNCVGNITTIDGELKPAASRSNSLNIKFDFSDHSDAIPNHHGILDINLERNTLPMRRKPDNTNAVIPFPEGVGRLDPSESTLYIRV